MTKQPLISIVIAAYNADKTIDRALQSAYMQTYDNTEIVIVDDCSTDSTVKRIEEFIKNHPKSKIRLIKHIKNGGSGKAHNTGHKYAQGEYIIFLDSDDFIDSTFIENLYWGSNGGEIDIVSGGLTIHQSNGDILILKPREHIEEGTERMTNHFLVHNVYLTNRIVRKKLLDEYPYCTRRVIDDVTTLFPLLYLANKVKFISDPGYHLTQNEGSVTNSNAGIRDTLFRALALRDYIEFFKDKEEEYQKIFNKGHYFRISQEILNNFPPQVIKEGADKYPEEWDAFIKYLKKLEEAAKATQKTTEETKVAQKTTEETIEVSKDASKETIEATKDASKATKDTLENS